jgi:WD40 repeat protein
MWREQRMAEEVYRYRAFISYRHVERDRKWARWLIEKLETYRTPRALVKSGAPVRIGHLFRDDDEIPASADLSHQIEDALRTSHFLIVVCSPDTPQSKWVQKEIDYFRSFGRGSRIFALLIDGEPEQSFPSNLLHIPMERTAPSGSRMAELVDAEPIAADVRPRHDERKSVTERRAFLRIVAGLLGVGYDDLVQRDRQRRVRRRWFLTTSAGAILLGVSALAGFTIYLDHQSKSQMQKELISAARYFLQQNRFESAARAAVAAQSIWPNAETDKLLRRVLNQSPRLGPVIFLGNKYATSLKFDRAGRRIFAGLSDGTLATREIDSQTGKIQSIRLSNGAINVLEIDNSGKLLTGSEDGTLTAVQPTASGLQRLFSINLGSPIAAIANGKYTAVALSNGRVEIFNLSQMASDLRPIRELKLPEPLALQFTSRGQLIGISRRHALVEWKIPTGVKVRSKLLKEATEDGGISCGSISPSGAIIVTGYCDGTLSLWNTNTGNEIGVPFVGHEGEVTTVEFSQAENIIVSGGTDSSVRVWPTHNVNSPNGYSPLLLGHTDSITAIAISNDGRKFATSASDNSIRIWDASRVHFWSPLLAKHPEVALPPEMAVKPLENDIVPLPRLRTTSQSGETTAQIIREGEIRIENINSGSIRTIAANTKDIVHMVLSPDGAVLAAIFFSAQVKIWAPHKIITTRIGSNLWLVAVDDSGELLAIADDQGAVTVRDGEGDDLLDNYRAAVGWQVSALQFSGKDALQVVTTDGARTINESMHLHRIVVPDGQRLVRDVCDRVLPGPLDLIDEDDGTVSPALQSMNGTRICTHSDKVRSSQGFLESWAELFESFWHATGRHQRYDHPIK